MNLALHTTYCILIFEDPLSQYRNYIHKHTYSPWPKKPICQRPLRILLPLLIARMRMVSKSRWSSTSMDPNQTKKFAIKPCKSQHPSMQDLNQPNLMVAPFHSPSPSISGLKLSKHQRRASLLSSQLDRDVLKCRLEHASLLLLSTTEGRAATNREFRGGASAYIDEDESGTYDPKKARRTPPSPSRPAKRVKTSNAFNDGTPKPKKLTKQVGFRYSMVVKLKFESKKSLDYLRSLPAGPYGSQSSNADEEIKSGVDSGYGGSLKRKREVKRPRRLGAVTTRLVLSSAHWSRVQSSPSLESLLSGLEVA